MKWMIASDIHGSAYWCRRMAEAYVREKADRLILLGDLLYHGPRNDLPEEYQPREVIDILNGMKDSILCVRGNCDAEVDQMVLQFPVMADYALLAHGTKNVFITHGHIHNVSNPPPLRKGDILLHGHTHVPACEMHDGYYYCNPGSVAIPKNGTPHGYMTLEGEFFLWKDMDGNVYRALSLE